MARRRGQRRGYLRKKGPSWLGSWYEDVRTSEGVRRMKQSKVICRAEGPGAKTKRQAERIAWEAVLRHSDPAMTAHYTHTDQERLRAGLNAVAARIVPQVRGGVM